MRSLILVSTSSEIAERGRANWQRLADGVEQRGFGSGARDASRAFAPGFAAAHPDVVAAAGEQTACNDPPAYAAAARAMSDYHWTAELARVRAPVLILQGLADQLTPPGGSVKMHRALPASRLLMLPDTGHSLPLEQPAVFTAAVLASPAASTRSPARSRCNRTAWNCRSRSPLVRVPTRELVRSGPTGLDRCMNVDDESR